MMEQSLSLILLYALLPACCLIIGGFITVSHLSTEKINTSIQHFAAGVVFAAVSIEMLTKVIDANAPGSVVTGFLIGLLAMVGMVQLSRYLKRKPKKASRNYFPLYLLSGIGVDLLVDGLLISIAFLAGTHGGILITFALALEELFLGMMTSKLIGDKKMSYSRQILINFPLASLILIGALLGFGVMVFLPSTATPFVLSFGMAALLYLVTQELLTEIHAKLETPWMTATFFLGFLCILMIETTFW